MLIIQGHDEEEFKDAEDNLGRLEDEKGVVGSINAIKGQGQFSTMRIAGTLKMQPITILVDTGSTHNVVHSRLVKCLNLLAQSHPGVKVGVAGVGVVKVDKFCNQLEWVMSGNQFRDDFMVMNVGFF